MRATNIRSAIIVVAAVLYTSTVFTADRAEIVITDTAVFPESLSSTADGRVFFGSTTRSTIYKSEPGSATAQAWILPANGALQRVLGVLADEAHRVLWVCSSTATVPDAKLLAGETALKTFALDSGAFRATFPFPGGNGACNDIAVAADGTAYATDTNGARLVRLKPGAPALEVWAADPLLAGADGIALLEDGAVYVNSITAGSLLRVRVAADGSAGPITKLETSRPLFHPDGMRVVAPHTLLLIEGGRLDEVTIRGDKADVRVLQEGFAGPTAVTLLNGVAYVLEAKLNYKNDPKLRGQDPGPFRAVAVPYPPK
jgi:sugar lactone lactonase YvrE